jgi:hypothetical protein
MDRASAAETLKRCPPCSSANAVMAENISNSFFDRAADLGYYTYELLCRRLATKICKPISSVAFVVCCGSP